jgi:broad specificity phosphatase PhoE
LLVLDREAMHIKLLLIRHSKSCANLIRERGNKERHTQRRRRILAASQKVRDPGLTKIGRQMAESYGSALRAKAQAAGFDLDTATIGSSALRRAKETAALLFPAAAAKLVVFPHLTEHGRIPENTPKRHAHTRPDWNAFLRHLRVSRATSEQATLQVIAVGHGGYLREVWRQLTGRPAAALHNLDAFVVEGDLDVRCRLTMERTERVPYTGRVAAEAPGDQCLLLAATRKRKRGGR